MIDGQPIRLAIVGSLGRMGRRLVALAHQADGLDVVQEVDLEAPARREIDPAAVDCVVDFSVRERCARTAAWCAEHTTPAVIGTTGLEAADQQALVQAAKVTPIVWAPNFSIGVNALFALAGELAKLLGEGWDLEVVEAHHRHKVDAPSGTATRLGELLAMARGLDYGEVQRCGRSGLVGPRPDDEIGMSVVRGGDVAGQHTVYYLADGEEVTLGHRATTRDIFVRGALRAARWAASSGREPGLYDMGDVLRTR